MKQQVVFIHGGIPKENYKSYLDYVKSIEYNPFPERYKRWRNTMSDELGEEYDIMMPNMPNKQYTDYQAWKIMFEKVLPHLNGDTIFIGHSLGGTFLLKYISEHRETLHIKALFLVAAAYTDSEMEKMGSFQIDNIDLPTDIPNVHLIHSKDDFAVPFSDFEALKHKLSYHNEMIFEDRGHFLQEEFPEIIEAIKKI